MFVFFYDSDEVDDVEDDEHLDNMSIIDVCVFLWWWWGWWWWWAYWSDPRWWRCADSAAPKQSTSHWLAVSRGSEEKMNFISKAESNSCCIWRFHYYMVVSVVLQPCNPQVRLDKVDDGDEEEEQAQERLHATEVEWRMINISDYKAVFVNPDVCICASSLKLFLKVNTWFPMTAWKATLW